MMLSDCVPFFCLCVASIPQQTTNETYLHCCSAHPTKAPGICAHDQQLKQRSMMLGFFGTH